LAVKIEFFPEKTVIQKSWSAKIFSVPPNSAPGLRHWVGRRGGIGNRNGRKTGERDRGRLRNEWKRWEGRADLVAYLSS